MNTTSGQPVTVDILGSAEKLVGDVIVQVLWLLAFIAFVAAAPILYFFFGRFCARSGDATFPMIYVFTSPLPVAVWTLFICRWRKIQQWQRAGRALGAMRPNWREAEGGWVVSILKSFGIMFLAGFSSFAAQMLTVFWYVHLMGRAVFFTPTYMTDPTPHDLTVFWSLMLLAAFSPVIVVLIRGWIRRRAETPSSTLSEQIAKAAEEGDTQQIVRIGKRGPTAAALLGRALEDHYKEKAEIYRQAAQSLSDTSQGEERRGTNERELELLSRLDVQIARIGEERG